MYFHALKYGKNREIDMKSSIKAFTILELSIVLVITSVLITGFFGLTVDKSIEKSTAANKMSLSKLDNAILKFYTTYGYLPCPAARDSALNSAGFGVSVSCAGAAGGTTDVGAGANIVKTGVVPVRTIGLSDADMFDFWGNRITYAVVRGLGIDQATFTATLPSTNAISILDLSGNSSLSNIIAPNHAAYVLVSHGPNNTGAYNYNGVQSVSCAGGGLDVENCNSDATFRSGFYTTSSYDDFITWQTRQVLKYYRDDKNKTVFVSPPSVPPTPRLAYVTFQTYGGWVGTPATGWNRRFYNYVLFNDIPGFTHSGFDDFVTVPAGTYYLKATVGGCRIDGFLTRIMTQGGTLLASSNAAYASDEVRDCTTSEAVGIATFAVPTNVVVDQYVQTYQGSFGYSWGTPLLLNVPFPWYYEPYASVVLEVQKWK